MEYIKKNGKPLDIRAHVGKTLKGFTVVQGSCTDGQNVYLIFERKKSKSASHRCKIVKMDIDSLKVVKVSQSLKLGHGNDMCHRDGILYVTHSEGSMVVHRVDAGSLKQKKGVKVTLPKKLKGKKIAAFNGIAPYGSGFILRVMGGSGMLIVNRNFRGTRFFRTKTSYTTSQGMDHKGGKIYRTYSKLQSKDKNFLVTYDKKGLQISRERIPVVGELEGVFLVSGKPWFVVYRKKNVEGEKKYCAFIGTVHPA